MARPADRFVSPLTDEEKANLKELWKNGESHRLRMRAHALLLSDQAKAVSEIAQIFDVTMQTVYDWIDRWESDRGLDDAPRSGAPPKLDEAAQREVSKLFKESPHDPKRVMDRLTQKTGIPISFDTLRRYAKKLGLRWKRARGSLKDRRDPVAFSNAKSELIELAQQHHDEELRLWFFDSAVFSLTPSIPYAWQPTGERISIPFQRGQSLSALGFVDLDNSFMPYTVEGTVDSRIVTAVMEHFVNSSTGFNVVVIDNAPAHRSEFFQSQIDAWEKQGVRLFFLPTYSPELNMIELVWKNIKHHWLPLRAYRSIANLKRELDKVLTNIGLSHVTNFPSLQSA